MSRVYTGDFDEKVTFRCSSALLDLCKAGAAASGLDISTYIRAALLTAAPRVQRLSVQLIESRDKDLKLFTDERCSLCKWCGYRSPDSEYVYCSDQCKMVKPSDCCDNFEKR